MKKLLFVTTLLASTLLLSSCKVNWFDRTVDVPWYYIAIFIAVLFVLLYFTIITRTYVCPRCNTEFKPKWYQLSVCMHFNGKRLIKCPECKRRGFCKYKR